MEGNKPLPVPVEREEAADFEGGVGLGLRRGGVKGGGLREVELVVLAVEEEEGGKGLDFLRRKDMTEKRDGGRKVERGKARMGTSALESC